MMQQSGKLFLLVVLIVTCLSATSDAADLKKGKTYIVITTAGKVFSGTLVKETKTSVVLKIANKRNVTILKTDIEEIREKQTLNRAMGHFEEKQPGYCE